MESSIEEEAFLSAASVQEDYSELVGILAALILPFEPACGAQQVAMTLGESRWIDANYPGLVGNPSKGVDLISPWACTHRRHADPVHLVLRIEKSTFRPH